MVYGAAHNNPWRTGKQTAFCYNFPKCPNKHDDGDDGGPRSVAIWLKLVVPVTLGRCQVYCEAVGGKLRSAAGDKGTPCRITGLLDIS